LPYLKNKKFNSYFYKLSPDVSKYICQIPVGQKLREEIDLKEPCFKPRAVSLRLADLRPCPKMTLGVDIVLKISSISFHSIITYSNVFQGWTDTQAHAILSTYRGGKIVMSFLMLHLFCLLCL